MTDEALQAAIDSALGHLGAALEPEMRAALEKHARVLLAEQARRAMKAAPGWVSVTMPRMRDTEESRADRIRRVEPAEMGGCE